MIDYKAIALDGVSPGLGYSSMATSGFILSGIFISVPSANVAVSALTPYANLTTNYLGIIPNIAVALSAQDPGLLVTENFLAKVNTSGINITSYGYAGITDNKWAVVNTASINATPINPQVPFEFRIGTQSVNVGGLTPSVSYTQNFYSNQPAKTVQVNKTAVATYTAHVWSRPSTHAISVTTPVDFTKLSDNFLGKMPQMNVGVSAPAPVSYWTENVFVRAITEVLEVSSRPMLVRATNNKFAAVSSRQITLAGNVLVRATQNYTSQMTVCEMRINRGVPVVDITGGWFLANLSTKEISFRGQAPTTRATDHIVSRISSANLGLTTYAADLLVTTNYAAKISSPRLRVQGGDIVRLSNNLLLTPAGVELRLSSASSVFVSDHKIAQVDTAGVGLTSYSPDGVLSHNELLKVITASVGLLPSSISAGLSDNVLISILPYSALLTPGAVSLGWTYLADVPKESISILGLNPGFEVIRGSDRFVVAYSGKVSENVHSAALLPGQANNTGIDKFTVLADTPKPTPLKSGVEVLITKTVATNRISITTSTSRGVVRGAKKGPINVK